MLPLKSIAMLVAGAHKLSAIRQQDIGWQYFLQQANLNELLGALLNVAAYKGWRTATDDEHSMPQARERPHLCASRPAFRVPNVHVKRHSNMNASGRSLLGA